jgi:hypothetical protein
MEKRIISEVSRIGNLMGVKPQLLKESKYWMSLADAIENFFSTTVPKSIKNSSDILLGNVRVERQIYDDILDIIDNPNLMGQADTKVLQALGRIISQDSTLVDTLYRTVMRDFFSITPGATEETLLRAIVKKMDSESKSLMDVLGDMTQDDFAVMNALRKKFEKKINEIETGTFKAEVSRPVTSTSKSISLTADEIAQFNRVVEAKGAKTFIGDIIQLFKKNLDEIKEEIIQLSNGFEQDIVGKTPEEVTQLLNAYAVAISRKLDLVEIRLNGAAADVLENSGLSKEIVNKIKTSKDAFFEVYRTARAADSQSFITLAWNTTKEFLVDIYDFVGNVFKLGWENSILKLFNPTTSVGQFFLTSNWATWNKLWRLAIKTSALQNKSKFIAQAAFASAVGSAVGSVLTSILGGLNEVIVLGNYNRILDSIADENGKIFGRDIESIKAEISDTSGEKNIIYKLFVPIVTKISETVWGEFEERGLGPVLISMVPGGITTFQDSLASGLLKAIVPGEDEIPNVKDMIYKLQDLIFSIFGYSREEVEQNVEDVEEASNDPQTTQVPQDLKDIMGNKQNEIKVKDDGSLYWGTEEYVVEKRNGQWEVFFPGDAWYNIKTEIEL